MTGQSHVRIDAHQHFWQIARPECTWPGPEHAAIHRDFGPADLAPLMAACGVTRSVLVQSQPDERDTAWLLQLAAQHESIAAVVGWLPLDAPDAPARIVALAAMHPKLRGLRPMLQSMPDAGWVLSPAVEPALGRMQQLGLVFDALVRAEQLPVVVELARRHPQLRIVLDHAGKPRIATGELDPWREQLAELARCPNTWCKLSGLATEASPGWRGADLEPVARHVFECFGPRRVLWGSDWPVLDLAGDYLAWHDLVRDWLGREWLPRDAAAEAAAEAAVFGGNARACYGL